MINYELALIGVSLQKCNYSAANDCVNRRYSTWGHRIEKLLLKCGSRLNAVYLVADRGPCHRVSGVRRIAFGEARVAADAIGSLADVYRLVLRSCASTNILRRYAALWYKTLTKPRVTAATRASPEANLQKALRAYH